MLGFLDELSNVTGLPFDEAYKDYKIVNLGGKAIYIQNYLKLLSYHKHEICLKIKNNEIIISGTNLIIKELGDKNLIITGNINSTYLRKEFLNNEKEENKTVEENKTKTNYK